METRSRTFKEIFGSEWGGKKIESIVIPIIQRDYAQGRKNDRIKRTRDRFLDALYDAVQSTPIVLDFVYGSLDDKGVLTPLDGQQRLTTLFLLHWFAAKKDNVNESEYSFLSRFGYETRYSARQFCKKIISYTPDFSGKISEEIIDQDWFPLDWKKDPTISSMLVMLDAIQVKFSSVDKLWERLCNRAITFYFLPIEELGLTDDLYIKMNSRGKPLTLFEHFKAELEKDLREVDPSKAETIIRKIDREWTNMLWPYRGSDNIIDDEFLRYFRFVCDIICYKKGESPQKRSSDEFDLLNLYFSKGADGTNDVSEIKDNINLMESMFDVWSDLSKERKMTLGTIASFFDEFQVNAGHEEGKIRLFNNYEKDVFASCLASYSDMIGGKNRRFSLPRIIYLYAVVVYLQNKATVGWEQFVRRMRIINNLIENSQYEISDSVDRIGGNRMPAIISQVECIMKTGRLLGQVGNDAGNNFNKHQLEEEQQKMDFIKDNPDKAEDIFRLEDHDLLYGQIDIVGVENTQLFSRFESLFLCDYDKIDCALLSVGDYTQKEQNGWRYQIGSTNPTAWKTLFHQSAAKGKTKEVLRQLLDKTENFSDGFLSGIIDDYLMQCEQSGHFDWRYYYIKYDCSRPGRYGKCWWWNRDGGSKEVNPYDFKMLFAPQYDSQNSFHVILNAVCNVIDEVSLDRNNCGGRLIFGEYFIYSDNNSFRLVDKETNDLANPRLCLEVPMEEGIDTKDRVLLGRDWLRDIIDGKIPLQNNEPYNCDEIII